MALVSSHTMPMNSFPPETPPEVARIGPAAALSVWNVGQVAFVGLSIAPVCSRTLRQHVGHRKPGRGGLGGVAANLGAVVAEVIDGCQLARRGDLVVTNHDPGMPVVAGAAAKEQQDSHRE
ncbi:MAG: hypothetical protein QF577_02700 [Phycisphaerae bacterium]|nr:hypothetical protein [Phycisphaerae bacterium]